MAIRKRKPGFMGLAEQNAREEGMYQVPKRYQPQGGGAEEYPAFVNQQEMALLKQQGSKGFITPYGIPSFSPASGYGSYGESKDEGMSPGTSQGHGVSEGGGAVGSDPTGGFFTADESGGLGSGNISWQGAINSIRDATQHQTADGTWVWNDPTKTEPVESINDASNSGLTPAQWQQQQQAAEPSAEEIAKKVEKKRLKDKRESKIEGVMRDADGRTADDKGHFEDSEGRKEGDEGFDPDDPEGGIVDAYDESTAKMDTTGSYEGYREEHRELGRDVRGLTEGVMTDATGKTEGQEGYDATTATMQGGFAGDVTKLGEYEGGFKDIAGAAQRTGEEGQEYFAGVMTDASGKKEGEEGYDASTAKRVGGAGAEFKDAGATGATKAGELSGGVMTDDKGRTAEDPNYDKSKATMQGGYKQTGEAMAAAAETGSEGFIQGAEDVKTVQKQFGKEGFQKEAGGYQSQIEELARKAQTGEIGQREAAMLKGQMEEGRMASQKGSEEKLRRSLAQSGASPSEIAAKVAQFQKQSAGQQAQAGRSEALSSQLQGQQMGQASLGQTAGLTGQAMGALGQKSGMAGQQASLGAQQAALRGRGAAMQMQGAQGQQAALAGMGAMNMQGTGMQMQGIQGAGQMYGQGMNAAFQGQQQQANMLGQGMGAVQAAGAARGQQMQGVETQGKFIDAQGQYTQAQLNDIIQQQTMAYNKEQADKTNAANAAANAGGGGGGGGFDLFNVGTWSDIRLKDNIELLEEGKDGDLNIYSFNYKWDSDTTWSGVMAQELLNTRYAGAVMMSPEGFYKVDYTKLGIQFKQLST